MAVLTATLSAAIGCWGNPAGVALAAVSQLAYPGMTIIQGNSRCTMGYVSLSHRTAPSRTTGLLTHPDGVRLKLVAPPDATSRTGADCMTGVCGVTGTSASGLLFEV